MRLQNGFTYSIIGYGRVGAALNAALHSAGGICTGIFVSRDISKLGGFKSNFHVLESISGLKPSDFVFVCVPDDAIESVSSLLPIDILLQRNTIVSHVSGSKPSSILSSLADKSVLIASSHPLMTFKIDSGSNIFHEITVSLEGDSIAVEELFELFRLLGSRPLIVTPDQKKLLHLGAVVTSNFISSLVFHAADILKPLDGNSVEFVRTVFGPLMQKTVQNILDVGYPSALTGPAARGDTTTINEHLDLLKKQEVEDVIYRELTSQILHFTKHK